MVKVESLEDIALKTCYQNVISTLRMGNLKLWMSRSSLFKLFSSLKDQELVDNSMNLRCEALKTTILNDQASKRLVEPDKFTVKDRNSGLIQVITKHSPLLSSLELNLGKSNIEDWLGKSFAQSFLGLKNLTRFIIADLADDEYAIPFLENIGTSCPQLTHLSLKSKSLFESKTPFLAPVLGQNAKLLPKVSNLFSRGLRTEKFMKRAHFHSHILIPFCSTLKHLILPCVEC